MISRRWALLAAVVLRATLSYGLRDTLTELQETRWHLQRIVQRTPLSSNQVYSGLAAFDLRSIDAKDVNVYVIDSGILIEHDEFEGKRAIYGANIRRPHKTPRDCDGHGTHVAAIAVGALSGIAPWARAIAVKILNCRGKGTCSNVLGALEWVARDSRRRRIEFGERSVAVMSIGSESNKCAPTLDAAKDLWDSGVFIAAAAGNEGRNACDLYPARSSSTVAVGAIDMWDRMYPRNNVGPCVDVFAPGVRILSAWGANSRGEMKRRTGTSMAAPVVGGIAAIILGAAPHLTSEEVREIILSSSTKGRILDPSGNSFLKDATNGMVFAPWAKLFDDIAMNDPTPSSNSTHLDPSAQGSIENKDWNSSSTFAALALTLVPMTKPAMRYSVDKITRAISHFSGIRERIILPRRAEGVVKFENGSEPDAVRLFFYMPMAPDLISFYSKRIIRAASTGDLQKKTNETIAFDGSDGEFLLMNVTVPPFVPPPPTDEKLEADYNTSRRHVRLILVSTAFALAAFCLVAGIFLVRRSLRKAHTDFNHGDS